MKKINTLFAIMLITVAAFAQTSKKVSQTNPYSVAAPEKMSYQAVIRDAANALVTNQAVGIQISILQTSATGNSVYVETQTATTNSNGLVSLEIGTGTIISGTFAGINWSYGPYFIQTDTDPTGLTNYTITGTSQLVSVPYALYAKTAGSATETQTLANVVAIGNTANGQLKNLTDPTDAQDATTKAYVDARIAILETRVKALESLIPAVIGDLREGGIVFWVDPVDNTHGLICAIQDQSAGIRWDNGASIATGATGVSIGAGASNTDAIIATQGIVISSYAAGLARTDIGWFLPSYAELEEMRLNSTLIDDTAIANSGSVFSTIPYWSSSEVTSSTAWSLRISGPESVSQQNKIDILPVRAVRYF